MRSGKLVAIVAMLTLTTILPAAPTGTAVSDNLLVNPRLGSTGWTPHAGGNACTSYGLTAVWAYSGTYSYEIIKSLDATQTICSVYQDIVSSSGLAYQASVHVNTVTLALNGPCLMLTWLSAAGSPLGYSQPACATGLGVQSLTVVDTAPPTTAKARFEVRLDPIMASAARIDQAFLGTTAGPAAPPAPDLYAIDAGPGWLRLRYTMSSAAWGGTAIAAEIWRGTSPGNEVYYTTTNLLPGGCCWYSYTDFEVLPDAAYYYKLRIWNTAGNSPFSITRSATPTSMDGPTSLEICNPADPNFQSYPNCWGHLSNPVSSCLLEKSQNWGPSIHVKTTGILPLLQPQVHCGVHAYTYGPFATGNVSMKVDVNIVSGTFGDVGTIGIAQYYLHTPDQYVLMTVCRAVPLANIGSPVETVHVNCPVTQTASRVEPFTTTSGLIPAEYYARNSRAFYLCGAC